MTFFSGKIYFVLGEHSADRLGADLLSSFDKAGHEVDAIGLGGKLLETHGLKSLFDINELSVMGISGVLLRLPFLLHRMYQTVFDIERRQPDLIILIDSPDFTHRVARRLRKRCPKIPIINYVCPSVWAWRSGRASAMRSYVDHVLAILPFEPEILQRLNGPSATYVGHPLAKFLPEHTSNRKAKRKDQSHNLLLLPGSRNSEISRLLPVIGETLDLLSHRGHKISCNLLAVPNLAERIWKMVQDWSVKPQILVGHEHKQTAFSHADLALAASGTITLELAINRIPFVSIYKFDPLSKWIINRSIKTWTASLPNLIADYPFVPERYNEFATAGNIARSLERFLGNTPERKTQMEGFAKISEAMFQERSASELAMDMIIETLKQKRTTP